MTIEDELRVKLMIAETRIIQLERELFNERNRKSQVAKPTSVDKKIVRQQVRSALTSLSKRARKVLQLTGGRCFYCDCELSVVTVTIDHLVPACKGGHRNIRNLVPACSGCNGAKGARLPTQEEIERAVCLHNEREEALKPKPGKVVQVRHWTHWQKENTA